MTYREPAGITDGLITREQSLAEMSVAQLKHLLATRWQIVLPGVYATFTGALSPRQKLRAAALYVGEHAQFADATALDAYRVRYVPRSPGVRLLIPATHHRVNRDFVIVRRTHRLPYPRNVEGFPYSPPERALVDTAARLGQLRAAIAMIADAVERGIADEGRLLDEIAHLTGRGSGVARQAVDEIVGGARSAPEVDFITLWRKLPGLPQPLLNPLLQLPCGRKISPDGLFLDSAVVHETNGREAHFDGEDLFESMQERHDAMTAADLTVLHSSPRQLRREGERVVMQVQTCVRRHAGRGLPPGVILLRDHA